MEQKQPYNKPTIETVAFTTEDVIRTSGTASFRKEDEGAGDKYSAADLF